MTARRSGYLAAAPRPKRRRDGHTPAEAVVLLVGLVLWWLVRHPRLLAVVIVAGWSVWWLGLHTAVLGWLAGLAAVGAWRYLHPWSFETALGWRLRTGWRGWWVYGRRWQTALSLCELAKGLDGTEVTPRLVKVHSGPIFDTVAVRMRSAQHLGDWERQAEALAHTFGALSCRVLPDGPGRLALELKHHDVLADPIPALPIPDEPRLDVVTIGLTERAEPWQLPVLGHHVLVAGKSGAGKGSVYWSVIRALAPLIAAGIVQVWVCDPKEGMEFAHGQAMFTRFAHDTVPMLDLLSDAVDFMKDRGNRLRGVTRLHTPTVDDPLLLVLVDEVAALTDVLGDKRQREKADQLLRVLMQQGRAIGVSVFGALQDPNKGNTPYRNLFTTRVALALQERTEPDMVLGSGARDRGAYCDRIPKWAKGTGYVLVDDQRQPTRVRAAYPTDDDIRAMAARYPAGPHADVIELADVTEGVPA